MTFVNINVDLMKVYVIQSKNGIKINVGGSVNNQMIGVLVKVIIYGIPARVIVNVIRHVKLMNI